MSIKISWVALSVVVLSVGVLLVASREDSLFSEWQPVVPERSAPPGTSVSADSTAPSLATPTPSSAPPAPMAAAPSAKPAPMPPEQPAPPPAPTAAGPSAPSETALPTTPPAPPAPTVAAPSVPPPATPSTAAAAPPPGALPTEDEMSAADRRQVQEALHRLDYYKGPLDGTFGPLTRAAIRRFQQGIGSEETGRLTADQANRLVTPR